VLRPVRRDATTDFYRVTARASTTEIIPGITTPIWGYQGISPGPTIHARKGRRVELTVTNALAPNDDPRNIEIIPEPEQDDHPFSPSGLSVHLHGVNTDAPHDGHPEVLFFPGESFTYIYPNNDYQRPATLWWHDHAVHITGPHVYRGLKAFYLLRDELEEALPLPDGEFDVPLVIADFRIDKSGILIYDTESHHGVAGDVITVNGRQQPRFAVANRKYRFRVLNGSDAREYRLALSDNSPFWVIGSDHGLLPAPVQVRSLRITPAERYEIVVDFGRYRQGTRVVLENRAENDPFQLYPRSGGAPELEKVMAFDVTRRAVDSSRVPAKLRPLEPLRRSEAVRQRDWLFDRENGYWSINGKQWDPDRVDARPAVDSVEIWNFYNKSGGWGHPVHPHLVRFLILEIGGRPPQAAEAGWKDTVWIGPNQHASVIMRFANFRGRYAFHCHNASHEDHDMMTQYETV
jgi:FtsP/CotA-like multicopper oxidase with cupredoxin domain